MIDLTNKVVEFTNMHDEFHADWNLAMSTGDLSALDRMTEDYYVAFFRGEHEKPLFFTKQDALDGMRKLVMHFIGAQKKFENKVIRMKNDDTAVVFYEQVIVRNEEVLARLFTIENWKLLNDKWMIVREIEEPIS
ncbi:DUF4440 domain-containing protein [Bacillus suaedaesalsae]|uniref:DUF4440 domain-containing protein n=1 Tax=Bacillus suaedaesalsae TaxID=2810349 RepID=UPI001EF601F7|nr:DUF4440 domain-containing protein [Bacillus suaedaesalsae]